MRMFEEVSRSLKYDSNFFGPQTYIYIDIHTCILYIYIWTSTRSLYPAHLCARVIKKYTTVCKHYFWFNCFKYSLKHID